MKMKIKPIKNEQRYRRVLKEIDTLMDAKANTAAGDRLDVLVTLAEAWEEQHHAIEPVKRGHS
jgi:HTH-type transcriptional regulator / antitoxin HigA